MYLGKQLSAIKIELVKRWRWLSIQREWPCYRKGKKLSCAHVSTRPSTLTDIGLIFFPYEDSLELPRLIGVRLNPMLVLLIACALSQRFLPRNSASWTLPIVDRQDHRHTERAFTRMYCICTCMYRCNSHCGIRLDLSRSKSRVMLNRKERLKSG